MWTRFNGSTSMTGVDMLFKVYSDDGNPPPIPEPATLLLLGSGLIGLAGARRKMKKQLSARILVDEGGAATAPPFLFWFQVYPPANRLRGRFLCVAYGDVIITPAWNICID